MNNLDKKYQQLLSDIIEFGVEKEDRKTWYSQIGEFLFEETSVRHIYASAICRSSEKIGAIFFATECSGRPNKKSEIGIKRFGDGPDQSTSTITIFWSSDFRSEKHRTERQFVTLGGLIV